MPLHHDNVPAASRTNRIAFSAQDLDRCQHDHLLCLGVKISLVRRRMRLTSKEYAILKLLMLRKGMTPTKDMILTGPTSDAALRLAA